MISNLKLFQFLFTFLGSFVGQLIVRITTLDGSLDKWWLLLPPLSVPPLSLIPAFYIYYDKIEKGHAGPPLDVYILIPAIMSIIFSISIEKKYKDPGPIGTILKFIIHFCTFTIALYLRDVDKCLIMTPITTTTSTTTTTTSKKAKKYINEDFKQLHKFNETFNLINNKPSNIMYNKLIVQSTIICTILPIIPYFLIKIPVFKNIINTVGTISPYIALLIDISIRLLTIILVYSGVNMYNGRNPDKLCKLPVDTKTVIYLLLFSIVINLLLSNKIEIVPFNSD